jgi:hypothetical protein
MNSNDEFLKALIGLETIIQEHIEYRIHYNEHGDITMCTMQDHPTDTTYLVATKDEYDNYFRYTVVNNKLKLIDIEPKYRVQLKKSDSGYQVVKNHAGVLVEPDEAYANTEYYDTVN